MSLKNWDNKTWLSSKNYIQSFNIFLLKQIKLNSNSHILDIGCGRGKILGSLSSRLKLKNKPIGIDIESTREIAGPGTSYFLNSSENKQWTNSELLSIWGAKESYFKKMKGRVDDLRSEATTLRISNTFVDLICNGKNHSFCVDQTEKYTLVYG